VLTQICPNALHTCRTLYNYFALTIVSAESLVPGAFSFVLHPTLQYVNSQRNGRSSVFDLNIQEPVDETDTTGFISFPVFVKVLSDFLKATGDPAGGMVRSLLPEVFVIIFLKLEDWV